MVAVDPKIADHLGVAQGLQDLAIFKDAAQRLVFRFGLVWQASMRRRYCAWISLICIHVCLWFVLSPVFITRWHTFPQLSPFDFDGLEHYIFGRRDLLGAWPETELLTTFTLGMFGPTRMHFLTLQCHEMVDGLIFQRCLCFVVFVFGFVLVVVLF